MVFAPWKSLDFEPNIMEGLFGSDDVSFSIIYIWDIWALFFELLQPFGCFFLQGCSNLSRHAREKKHRVLVVSKTEKKLGGGFKYVSCSALLEEMIQFDEHIFQMGWFETTN